MDSVIARAIDFMRDNLRQRVSVGRLSQTSSLSRSRFSHLFKDQTGLPPAQYLKQLRIQRARELLETTSHSIKVICALIGIKDESHFVRDFGKLYGLSPSKYRAYYLSSLASRNPPKKITKPNRKSADK